MTDAEKPTVTNSNAANAAKDTRSYPRFISTAPSGKDLFDGQSQDRLAEEIASGIFSDIHNSSIIGLEGKWGSGKSNVIKLLREKLKRQGSECHAYTYDAWVHQEDLRRKSFIEECAEEIKKIIRDEGAEQGKDRKKKESKREQEKREKKEEKFEEMTDKILARKTHSSTKTTPHINLWLLFMPAIFFAVLYLSDCIINMLNTFDEINIDIRWGRIIAFTLLAGIGIPKKIRSRLFSIYSKEASDKTTHDIISERDTTLIEFRKWCTWIDKNIDNTKLIIVFDNIDRLPPKKIATLWSSINTFFADQDYEKDQDYENIWVIIPFERRHLRQVFEYIKIDEGDGDATNNNAANSNSDAEKIPDHIKAQTVTNRTRTIDEYINKTFSIVYRVPPPILSDWKGFFVECFQQAFGSKQESRVAMSVFATLTDRFIPRDIIAFINDLVALKRRWRNKIDIRYMSIYILCCKEFEAVEEILSLYEEGSLHRLRITAAEKDEFMSAVAAIHYNVKIERAQQILWLERLRSIPNTNTDNFHRRFLDGDDLGKAAKQPGFLDALGESLQYPNIYPHIVNTIEKLYTLTGWRNDASLSDKERQLSDTWYAFFDNTSDIWYAFFDNIRADENLMKKWSFIHRYLLSRLRNADKDLLVSCLTDLWHKFLDRKKTGEHEEVISIEGSTYFKNLNGLEKFIGGNKFKLPIKSFSEYIEYKKVTPGSFLSYLQVAGERYAEYKVTTDNNSLNTYLGRTLFNAFDDTSESSYIKATLTEYHMPSHRDSLLQYLEKDDAYNFKYLKKDIKDCIIEPGRHHLITLTNVYAVFAHYKTISTARPLASQLSVEKIKELLSHEKIKLSPSQVSTEEIPDAALELFAMRLGYGEEASGPLDGWLHDPPENLAKDITHSIECYHKRSTLFELSPRWNAPLLQMVLKELSENKGNAPK